MKLQVALLQLRSGRDKLKNLRNAAIKIREAAQNGAELVVLPECFQSPYSIDSFREYSETEGGPTQDMLSRAAKESSIYLIGGSMPELESGKVYNTSFVYDPLGNLIATHRKLHLFDINVPGRITFQESLTLSAGSLLTYFDIPAFGKIGLGICYDVRFPEMAIMMARKYGVLAMIYPGAFNMTTGPLHWELLLRSRALDNQIFVAGCAPARDENASYVAWGHSTFVNPMGLVIGHLQEEEGILMTTWDSKEVLDARTSIPVSHQRRFDVYPDICAIDVDSYDSQRPIKKKKEANIYDRHFQVLELLATKPKKKNLLDLTKKYIDLASACASKDPCFLTLDELGLVMDWKLQRGKFRPQLKSLIESNDPDKVLSITKEAFSKDWPENLTVLTELRGVGPATATALLSLVDSSVPFFSDEVASIILEQEKLKYTLKEVLLYVDRVRAKAVSLNVSPRDYEIMKFTEFMKKKLSEE